MKAVGAGGFLVHAGVVDGDDVRGGEWRVALASREDAAESSASVESSRRTVFTATRRRAACRGPPHLPIRIPTRLRSS